MTPYAAPLSEGLDSLASYLTNGVAITAPELHIAHISDIHFVTHPVLRHIKFKGMVGHDQAVIGALEHELQSLGVDLLFVTGDLSTWGDQKSLRDAKTFILRLAKKLGLDRERVFWIPGNHDVIVDYHKVALKSRNFTKICGATPVLRELNVKGMELAIFSFDSTFREGFWPFTSNRGAVTPEAFNSFNEALQAVRSRNPDAIKLVQIHHHPLPIPYKKDNGVSGVLTTMTNGATFMDRMQETGIALIMHGHEHYPYSASVTYHPEQKPTVLVAAGTACQVENHEMSFNYLTVKTSADITLRRYVYRETGFSIDRNSTKVFTSN